MTVVSIVHHPGGTREAILDAAARRFAAIGFEGACVRDIAADAGLKNQASLYQYFRDKRALYEATLAQGIASVAARFSPGDTATGDRTGSVADAPAAYLDGVIDYLVANPYLARLIQGAGQDDSRFVRDALPRLLRPLYEEGLRVLSRTDGRWNPEYAPHLAAGLYHLIFGYFANPTLMEVVLGGDPQSADAIARQRRFLKIAVARLIGDEPHTPLPTNVRDGTPFATPNAKPAQMKRSTP
ncbi:MAG: TetR/AcrR family transcriptional regulator [Chloroflexota bacterium]|nr:TetR/AcrR family transcriptional regulator [Chloroflexota bacterium]